MIELELIIFPHAGGGPSFFNKWGDHFPGKIKVTPYCLPGREARFNESLDFTIEELIDKEIMGYISKIKHPICFMGHSMGALISYLLTMKMASLGLELPRMIILSSFTSPSNYTTSGKYLEMNDIDFKKELVAIGGLPHELQDNEFLDFYLPIIKKDFINCEGIDFTNRKPLPIPITVLGGWQDKMITPEALVSWEKETSVEYNQFFFPGDHFYLKKEQINVINLLNNILQKLLLKEIKK